MPRANPRVSALKMPLKKCWCWCVINLHSWDSFKPISLSDSIVYHYVPFTQVESCTVFNSPTRNDGNILLLRLRLSNKFQTNLFTKIFSHFELLSSGKNFNLDLKKYSKLVYLDFDFKIFSLTLQFIICSASSVFCLYWLFFFFFFFFFWFNVFPLVN